VSTRSTTYGEPETRRRILEAAWDLLEKRGPIVTIADVAQLAGVSRQAVYLHFGDRAGLFVALVDHIDVTLGSAEMREKVFGAPTGAESLRRFIATLSWYTEKIDVVSYFLESAQYQDPALRAAWRNRMGRRQDIIRTIVERIAAEGRLRKGCNVDTAVDLIYAVTMPGTWRELTRELGWTNEQYSEHVTEMVERTFLRKSPSRGT
jgi:AcrR family transcriptional regulator